MVLLTGGLTSLCLFRFIRLTLLATVSGFRLDLDSGYPYVDYPVSRGLDYRFT